MNIGKKVSPINLSLELIEETVKNPDLIILDKNNPKREWRVKKIKGRCLKVIVEFYEKEDKLKVITVFWDRNLRRRGLCK